MIQDGLAIAGEQRLAPLVYARALHYLARMGDSYEEAIPIFEKCVAACRSIGPEADSELTLALAGLALHRFVVEKDVEAVRPLAEESIQIGARLNGEARWNYAQALYEYTCILKNSPPDFDQACVYAAESLRLFRAMGDIWTNAGFWTIGEVEAQRGNYKEAIRCFEEVLITSRGLDVINEEISLFQLSVLHGLAGDISKAIGYAQEFVRLHFRLAETYWLEFKLLSLGALLVRSALQQAPGQKRQTLRTAAILMQAGQPVYWPNDEFLMKTMQAWVEEAQAILRSELSPAEFLSAVDTSRQMTPNQVMNLVNLAADTLEGNS
jgi:tetratricopeptide (TPR) repeat protein